MIKKGGRLKKYSLVPRNNHSQRCSYRGEGGSARAPLVDQLTLSETEWAYFAPQTTASPPGFKKLPTPLTHIMHYGNSNLIYASKYLSPFKSVGEIIYLFVPEEWVTTKCSITLNNSLTLIGNKCILYTPIIPFNHQSINIIV